MDEDAGTCFLSAVSQWYDGDGCCFMQIYLKCLSPEKKKNNPVVRMLASAQRNVSQASIYIFKHCAYGLLRFRHEIHLVRVRKTSCSG